jgi:sugar/nucleoside kinase (ribokinase family)
VKAGRVLAAGTVALDTVETPAGRSVRRPGGSALYFGLAARFFAPVAVAGVHGEDFPPESLRALRSAGLDTSALQGCPGETFRWHVRYDGSGDRTTLETNRRVALGGVPEIPEVLKDPDVLFLGSTDPSVQRRILEASGSPGHVALDTMAHWIRDRREELGALLAATDVFFVSAEELSLLGGADADRAVARILTTRVRWLLVKHGSRGATAYAAGHRLEVSAVPTRSVVDPTGAGDAFAGGLIGSLTESGSLEPEAMGRALAYASVTGALAVESFSFERLLAVGREGVDERASVLMVTPRRWPS